MNTFPVDDDSAKEKVYFQQIGRTLRPQNMEITKIKLCHKPYYSVAYLKTCCWFFHNENKFVYHYMSNGRIETCYVDLPCYIDKINSEITTIEENGDFFAVITNNKGKKTEKIIIIDHTTEIVEQQEKENIFETIRKNSMELRKKYPHLNSLEALLKEAEESEE